MGKASSANLRAHVPYRGLGFRAHHCAQRGKRLPLNRREYQIPTHRHTRSRERNYLDAVLSFNAVTTLKQLELAGHHMPSSDRNMSSMASANRAERTRSDHLIQAKISASCVRCRGGQYLFPKACPVWQAAGACSEFGAALGRSTLQTNKSSTPPFPELKAPGHRRLPGTWRPTAFLVSHVFVHLVEVQPSATSSGLDGLYLGVLSCADRAHTPSSS